MKKELTQEYLKKMLDYNPSTGIFTWKVNICNVKAGAHPKKIHSKGYLIVVLGGVNYLAHRLAWFYVYGVWPEEVDHRDTNKMNNTIDNLREATRAQNCHNIGISKRNTTGYKCVKKEDSAFVAVITVNYKKIRIGRFKTAEAAYIAYCEAAKKYHGEFARVA